MTKFAYDMIGHVDAEQWFSHETTPNEFVRRTSYMEVGGLQEGTSGCTRDHPYWTWTACGVLDGPRGPQLVTPTDFIVTSDFGFRMVVPEAIFAASFRDPFITKSDMPSKEEAWEFELKSRLDMRMARAMRVVEANPDLRVVILTRTKWAAEELEHTIARQGRQTILCGIEMGPQDTISKFLDFQTSDNAVMVLPHYVMNERFPETLSDKQSRQVVITATSVSRRHVHDRAAIHFVNNRTEYPPPK